MSFKKITFNVDCNDHISRKKDILHKMCEQLHVSNAKIAQFHYHFHTALQG